MHTQEEEEEEGAHTEKKMKTNNIVTNLCLDSFLNRKDRNVYAEFFYF